MLIYQCFFVMMVQHLKRFMVVLLQTVLTVLETCGWICHLIDLSDYMCILLKVVFIVNIVYFTLYNTFEHTEY